MLRNLLVPVVVASLIVSCGGSEGAGPTMADDVVGATETSPSEPPRSSEPAPTGSANPAEPVPTAPAPTTPTPTPAKPAPVTFQVLTYNVAGLPEGISKSDPGVNTPQMSPKLNPFELVLVQEDFAYHDDLVASATHPHLSMPMSTKSSLGDGLNTLSRFPFSAFSRTKWSKCNGYIDQGSDCLTPKGFSRFVLDLGDGRSIDVYDVHFDAGRETGDVKARDAQVDQLAAAIAEHSAGKAVIIAGDTNMKVADEPTFQKLLSGSSLQCACRTLNCPEPNRIDRILFRSGSALTLVAKNVAVESSFVNSAGEPLSDHDPVSVTFEAD